jgi:hypothetical protein
MPSKRYLHDHPDFSDLTRVVAGERKIDPYLVEKDYWLMHALYGLQLAGYDFQLKGGTSLSKGYGIIHRFSEDIDIHIVPPDDVQVRTSKNHDKEKDRQSRKSFYDYLATHIRIPGIVSVERDTAFDALPKYLQAPHPITTSVSNPVSSPGGTSLRPPPLKHPSSSNPARQRSLLYQHHRGSLSQRHGRIQLTVQTVTSQENFSLVGVQESPQPTLVVTPHHA